MRAATPAPRSSNLVGLIGTIVLLGFVAAIGLWAALPLIEAKAWVALGIVVAATATVFYIYLSPRRVPAKFLVPGTLLLLAFQVSPVLYTVGTAFTNFGDGHRGDKTEAIVAIQTGSVRPVAGSTEYVLSVGTSGEEIGAPVVFLLTDPATKQVFAGDARGLRALPADGVTVSSAGKVTAARGYTVLGLGQASQRSADIIKLTVPTTNGAIRSSGLSRAYEGQATKRFDAGCDCVRDADTGRVWTADADQGSFVDKTGDKLPQGWQVNLGLRNFASVLFDSTISTYFLGILGWNLMFALGTVLLTFVLGLLCAIALDSARVRGRRYYRVLLVLPYAMPTFAMLLVWRDMFNTDFGLINRLTGLGVDWFGQTWTARAAILLVQLWLGYPYMFLVATGALQAIPRELTDAARIDGASPWQAFRNVTLPLVLVALTPLLIASFAFNFNNFNTVYLTTEGGPFSPDNPRAGATDLLITYTYRLAFGGQGAQYGFAAAVSVYIFLIVAILSAVSFRRTRRQEEVYR